MQLRGYRIRPIAVALVAVALVPVGLAHLAVNTVPDTRAGVSRAELALPTTLSAATSAKVNVAEESGHDYYNFPQMEAVLSQGGHAISGVSITFTVAGHTVCEAITDQHGRAGCDNSAKHDVALFGSTRPPTSYTARFGGSGALTASDIQVDLRPIDDGDVDENPVSADTNS